MILILHNIRSVHNVGSCFRTADAAGVEHIILSGYSPTPLDRFTVPRKDFAKVSLGAEKTVPWKYVETLEILLEKLKKEKCTIVAIEQDARSVPLFDWQPEKNKSLAVILGNEVDGIEKLILDAADVILEIPMYGTKESLNVSVTAGIALFTLKNRL